MGVYIKQMKTHLKSSLNMGNYFKSTLWLFISRLLIIHDQIFDSLILPHTQT